VSHCTQPLGKIGFFDLFTWVRNHEVNPCHVEASCKGPGGRKTGFIKDNSAI
jgi:hypothetical protein